MIDEYLKERNLPLGLSEEEKEAISNTCDYAWWNLGKALFDLVIELKKEFKDFWNWIRRCGNGTWKH